MMNPTKAGLVPSVSAAVCNDYHGDDQFGQVPQRGIEQSPDSIAGLCSDGIGCVTEKSRQTGRLSQGDERLRCG